MKKNSYKKGIEGTVLLSVTNYASIGYELTIITLLYLPGQVPLKI